MSIAPSDEDYISEVICARQIRLLREMLAQYDGHLSPYQRAQLLSYLGIDENSSQQPCLPDKDAPNYI